MTLSERFCRDLRLGNCLCCKIAIILTIPPALAQMPSRGWKSTASRSDSILNPPKVRLTPYNRPAAMTKEEKEAMLLVARTSERLLHENTCLKALLQKCCENPDQIPHWKMWLDRMMQDEKLAEPVREKFRYIYSQIERSADPSEALKALLRDFPISVGEKPN